MCKYLQFSFFFSYSWKRLELTLWEFGLGLLLITCVYIWVEIEIHVHPFDELSTFPSDHSYWLLPSFLLISSTHVIIFFLSRILPFQKGTLSIHSALFDYCLLLDSHSHRGYGWNCAFSFKYSFLLVFVSIVAHHGLAASRYHRYMCNNKFYQRYRLAKTGMP